MICISSQYNSLHANHLYVYTSVGDPDPDPQIRIRDPPIFTGIQIRKRSAIISADPDLRYTFNI